MRPEQGESSRLGVLEDMEVIDAAENSCRHYLATAKVLRPSLGLCSSIVLQALDRVHGRVGHFALDW